MARKWKARWPMYKLLVVADEDGTAKYSPFVVGSNHKGEAFWIAGQKFKVKRDNSIHLGKKFMKEYGYVRPDGRRALILESFGHWYPERYKGCNYKELNDWLKKLAPLDPVRNQRYVQAAKIWYGKSIEECYLGSNDDMVLIDQRLYEDLVYVHPMYEKAVKPNGWRWTYTKNNTPTWYQMHQLKGFPEVRK